jgi:pimeloyl-ACP methyl ester carboxylesterase
MLGSAMADASTASGLAFLRGRIGRATPGEPLLLFAHGSGFNAAIWRPTIERLARLRPALSAEVVALGCLSGALRLGDGRVARHDRASRHRSDAL